MKKYNVIDLFAGCGGLSEGFLETEKFNILAHIEWEMPMVETLRKNLIQRWNYSERRATESVIRFDIQKTDELLHGQWSDESVKKYAKGNSAVLPVKGLDGIIKEPVDIIIGGPPCQAYSIAGRAQDPHSMKNDYRNYLFESFIKVVDYYKPKIFVFENVPGILSAKPGDKFVIQRIYEAFDEIGYEIRTPENMKKSIYSSVDFNVPQDRHRVIILGINKKNNLSLERFYELLNKQKKEKFEQTVRNAIGSLPKIKPLKKSYKVGNTNVSHEVIGENNYSNHTPRYHNERDIKIFHEWILKDMNNCTTQEKLAFYKKVTGKTSNHNKYRNLEWDKPSPTIVSHLYKDGLMFIHPDIEQLRSITVLEAGLLQTFPADYPFVGSNAYCYKMIGNAVPVQFAKNIAEALYLGLGEKNYAKA